MGLASRNPRLCVGVRVSVRVSVRVGVRVRVGVSVEKPATVR